MVRTPLTYYGGKQALSRQIVPLFPTHRCYLEPFCGGAAVLFAKPRAERETINDLDRRVVTFWKVLRERPEELAAAIATTPYSRAEWRGSAEDAADELESARRFLVNVDQSFSRSRRSWSAPCIGDGRGRWQPGTWENLPPKLIAAAERLRGVAIECADALGMIPRWDRSDALIYIDPPYTGLHRLSPKEGYAHDADGTLWWALVDVLSGVTQASVVVSGYPCEQMDALGWRSIPLAMKRTVQSRDGAKLPYAPEMVWLSPSISDTGRLFQGAVS